VDEEIKVKRWKIARAISMFGLGGSEVILDEIMKTLKELENVNDCSSPVGSLFGRLRSSDKQDGAGEK
jgi:hypothetical protein